MKFLLLVILIFSACEKKEEKLLVAYYGVEPELFWLIKYDMELINTHTFEDGSTLNSLEWASTVYYEPISNSYYFSTIEKTNGIVYDTNNIQDEQAYIEHNPSSWKHLEDSLVYIGSIDFSNRVYINTNNQQYLKRIISKIDTSFYLDHNRQVQLLHDPVYPFLDTRLENPEIVLSNKQLYLVMRYLMVNDQFLDEYPNGTLIQQPEGDYTTSSKVRQS